MVKTVNTMTVPSLAAVDRSQGFIGRQLMNALRAAISKGELRPGERLPSTRALSRSLKLARGTVMEAFDQLKAEGYLQSCMRGGTLVALKLDINPTHTDFSFSFVTGSDKSSLPPSATKFERLADKLMAQEPIPFAMDVPIARIASDINWRRAGNRIRASLAAAPIGYGDSRGLHELRTEIAEYVRKARGAKCDADQVILTSGTQQGLYLSASVLLSSNDGVWLEDPHHLGLVAVLRNLDISVHAIPIDDEGINVDMAIATCAEARAAFVTPSNHYPLGTVLSTARRTALLEWAQRSGGWIVENDYDNEFRYSGHPLKSLQGADPTRVVYLGTFNKLLFPSMRIGFMVVPKSLVQAFVGARAIMDRQPPTVEQHVLAAYMREGHFEAHVRRMRHSYSERRKYLIETLARTLPDWVSIEPAETGTNLVVSFLAPLDDRLIAESARASGVAVRAISSMYDREPAKFGLIVGFGGFNAVEVSAAADKLRKILDSAREQTFASAAAFKSSREIAAFSSVRPRSKRAIESVSGSHE